MTFIEQVSDRRADLASPGTPLHVAVVSRHELIRVGLHHLLSTDPSRAVVADLSHRHSQLRGHDVAVYDLNGLVDSTVDDLSQLLRSGVPVVALEPHARADLGRGALAAGVAAVVPMSITAPHLLDVLDQAAAGRRRGEPARRSEDNRAEVARRFDLSPRELCVLELIGRGLSNIEIAERVYLSVNTIKTCIRSAYGKIGVQSRSQAVLWVIENHLGTPTDPSPSPR